MISDRRTLALAGLALLVCGVFLLPALFNGQPFLFPDSLGYFRAGEAALHTLFPMEPVAGAPGGGGINVSNNGVSTERSPFYGLLVALAEMLGSAWALPVLQVVVALVAVTVALRHMGVADPVRRLVLVGLLGLVTGIGIFATTVMPDLFAGLMILAIALLLACRSAMPRGEQLFWYLLAFAACLFHKSHLAVAAVMLGFALLLFRRVDRRALASLGAIVLAALAGHLMVDRAVERVTGHPPQSPPFLLARMIGDGTVPRYLDEACPTHAYRLCRYRDRMPMTENEFLWSPDPRRGLLGIVPAEERAALIAESGEITRSALAAHPGEQVGAAFVNFGRQLLVVGTTEFAQRTGMDPAFAAGMSRTLNAYKSSRVMAGSMPMGALSLMMTLVYLGAAIGLAFVTARRPAFLAAPRPLPLVRLLLIVGVVANAAVCGIISGVFDRYQGRVAWILPLILLAWAVERRLASSSAHLPKPNTSW